MNRSSLSVPASLTEFHWEMTRGEKSGECSVSAVHHSALTGEDRGYKQSYKSGRQEKSYLGTQAQRSPMRGWWNIQSCACFWGTADSDPLRLFYRRTVCIFQRSSGAFTKLPTLLFFFPRLFPECQFGELFIPTCCAVLTMLEFRRW